MTTFAVEAVGAQRLAATAHAAAAELADLTPVNQAAADLVIGAVAAPVRTGRLAGTVAAIGTADGFEVRAGGPGAPYAAIVHARNPFLTRALDRREDDVVNRYVGHVEDVVDTIQGA